MVVLTTFRAHAERVAAGDPDVPGRRRFGRGLQGVAEIADGSLRWTASPAARRQGAPDAEVRLGTITRADVVPDVRDRFAVAVRAAGLAHPLTLRVRVGVGDTPDALGSFVAALEGAGLTRKPNPHVPGAFALAPPKARLKFHKGDPVGE